MPDVILFGDARAAVVDELKAVADRAEPYASGVHVAGDYDGSITPALSVPTATVTGSAPHVQYVTVRVVAWHHTSADVHDLAQLALAVLLTSERLACVRMTGPAVTLDPDDGRPMAAFTVRVAMLGALA